MHKETNSSKELNKQSKEKVLHAAVCISKIRIKMITWNY